MKRLLALAIFTASLTLAAVAADDSPTTLMTRPGRLLVSEDFSKPLPPPVGSTAQFASGFKGWRCNVVERGGHWDVVDGTFRGVENPAVNHPATASIGFDFKNVVIACEVRLHDVPLDGRKSRGFSVRTTDAKDYVCSLMLNTNGFRIEKSDNDHGGPDKPVPFGAVIMPIKLGEWQKVVIEILGDEMVGTVNGRSLTGQHPLIGTDKKSIMFVSQAEGAVRHLRVWEAEPDPGWAKNRQKLTRESRTVGRK
ncbi:MAG TPA: hypothetical protein VI454_18670 [Verrucomicrobiae bacterium]